MWEVIKILGTFVLGFTSAVFAEPLRRWIFSSAVSIQFKPSFGAGSRHIALIEEKVENHSRMAKYIRARVNNTTCVTAKSCRAFLMKIERADDLGGKKELHHDPLPLAWSFLGYSPIDIPPHTEFYFDIFSVNEVDQRMEPATFARPLSWPDLLRQTGKYWFTFFVVGDNVRAKFRTVSFEWKGSFVAVTEDSFG